MKKNNNKGMTIIELLVCFVLVSIITTSLFATISTFSNKRDKESIKSTIFSYKNRIAKEIQDDLVNKSLVDVSIIEPNANSYVVDSSVSVEGSETNLYNYKFDENKNTYRYAIFFKFRDGTSKALTIRYKSSQGYMDDDSSCDSSKRDDDFYITYGEQYPGYNKSTESDIKTSVENPKDSDGNFDLFRLPDVGNGDNACGEKVLDLRFDDISVIKENNVFKLYIGFYHPDIGKEYALDIVAPLNYFSE